MLCLCLSCLSLPSALHYTYIFCHPFLFSAQKISFLVLLFVVLLILVYIFACFSFHIYFALVNTFALQDYFLFFQCILHLFFYHNFHVTDKMICHYRFERIFSKFISKETTVLVRITCENFCSRKYVAGMGLTSTLSGNLEKNPDSPIQPSFQGRGNKIIQAYQQLKEEFQKGV